jgi:hypothetical protein
VFHQRNNITQRGNEEEEKFLKKTADRPLWRSMSFS